MENINEGYVKSEPNSGITTIEFFHPQSNSLPGKMLDEIAQHILLANKDDCNVIVLKSAGNKAFCAGASFNELATIKTEEDGVIFFSGFAKVINAMRKCSKIIIGRIQGKCVGGGVGIVAACDYAIAVEGADIKLSELSLGIGPFVVGPAVERKIGSAAFTQLAINASTWYSSDWATQKGLYAEQHADVIRMDESVQRLSSSLANTSQPAMAELKKILWQGTENWDELLYERAAISGRLVLSDFTKKYIQQFKEKQGSKK